MIRKIKLWPDPVLLAPCIGWDFTVRSAEDAHQLATDLIETMRANSAIGLAANQIGQPDFVFAMRHKAAEQNIVLFNPVVKSVSEELWTAPEGCLSFPGVELTIPRPMTVIVEFRDQDGEKQRETFSEIDAKCVLHELDHLHGRVFKDYVSRLKFDMARKRSKKK